MVCGTQGGGRQRVNGYMPTYNYSIVMNMEDWKTGVALMGLRC